MSVGKFLATDLQTAKFMSSSKYFLRFILCGADCDVHSLMSHQLHVRTSVCKQKCITANDALTTDLTGDLNLEKNESIKSQRALYMECTVASLYNWLQIKRMQIFSRRVRAFASCGEAFFDCRLLRFFDQYLSVWKNLQ